MSEPALPEKILALHDSLARAGIAHAFGGALALAYYAEPRATDDIDVNLFTTPASVPGILQTLEPLGVHSDLDPGAVERDGQCRLWWGRTPLDLFFAYDEIHEAMRHDTRLVPFGDERVPILSPEHLLACKAIFDRPKDWLDIEQMLVCVGDLDAEEVRTWLDRIVGADDPRRLRFDEALEAV